MLRRTATAALATLHADHRSRPLLLGDEVDIIAAMAMSLWARPVFVRLARRATRLGSLFQRCAAICLIATSLGAAAVPADARAQLRPSAPVVLARGPVPAASLVAEDRRYAASFAGIRAYMNELASANPARHRVLTPAFDALLKRRRRLAGVGASLVLAGLCSVALALAFDDDLPRSSRIGTMYGGATGMFVGGAMLGVLGSRHEAQRFVEVHQRLVPSARLRLELAGTARSAHLLATARF